jgi:hypothetical protein
MPIDAANIVEHSHAKNLDLGAGAFKPWPSCTQLCSTAAKAANTGGPFYVKIKYFDIPDLLVMPTHLICDFLSFWPQVWVEPDSSVPVLAR